MTLDSAAQSLVDIRQINDAAARKLKASRWPRAKLQNDSPLEAAATRLAFLPAPGDKCAPVDAGWRSLERRQMEELIQRIGASVGIDENTAKAAIGHVLGFVQKEIPEGPVADLINKLPGAQEAIAAAATPIDGLGAALGGLGGMLGGAGGNIMGLAGKLGGLGLDMGQMQKLSHEIFAHAEELIGKENVDKIIAAIPALAPFR